MNNILPRFLLLMAVLLTSFAEAADVTATWAAPTVRQDGQPLSVGEIGGYRLEYECGDSPKTVLIGASEMQYVVQDLPAGTCSFRLAVFDVAGAESDFSEPIVIAIGSNPESPEFNAALKSTLPTLIDECRQYENCSISVTFEFN